MLSIMILQLLLLSIAGIPEGEDVFGTQILVMLVVFLTFRIDKDRDGNTDSLVATFWSKSILANLAFSSAHHRVACVYA